MCSNELIYKIQKERLSDVQSALDKLINSINKSNREPSKYELSNIILLNDKIDEIVNLSNDITISLLKKKSNRKLNDSQKQELKDHDHAETVIGKFLPAMLAYSMSLD